MSNPGGVSAAAGWHPDPAGRHQFRWWDGARWTDRVADQGAVASDPLSQPTPAAVSPHAEEILGRTRLHVRSGGGSSLRAAWWQVTDDERRPVAQVWRQGRSARLCDLDGAPVLGTEARTIRPRRTGQGSGTDIAGIAFLDAAGHEWAMTSHVQGVDVTFRVKVGGERLLTVKVDRAAFSGQVRSAELLGADGRVVGAIAVSEYDGNLLGTANCWLVLDRDPQLVDPVRSLVMATPLMLNCYLWWAGN